MTYLYRVLDLDDHAVGVVFVDAGRYGVRVDDQTIYCITMADAVETAIWRAPPGSRLVRS